MHIFGYGSLMYEPELPAAVVSAVPAMLPGWSRGFNKRSVSRGCAASDAITAQPVPGFEDAGHRLSLVLGTQPGSGMAGLLMTYPEDVAVALLAGLAAREGPGYRRCEVVVQVADTHVNATTWLTNPSSDLIVALDRMTQAEVLWAATPRLPAVRALGVHYLLRTHATLADHGLSDRGLDLLVAEVRRQEIKIRLMNNM